MVPPRSSVPEVSILFRTMFYTLFFKVLSIARDSHIPSSLAEGIRGEKSHQPLGDRWFRAAHLPSKPLFSLVLPDQYPQGEGLPSPYPLPGAQNRSGPGSPGALVGPLGPSWRPFFRGRFFDSFSIDCWSVLTPQNHPEIEPKSTKNLCQHALRF